MAQLAWQWRERGQRDPSIAGYQPGGVRLWEKQDLHQESQNGTLTCLYMYMHIYGMILFHTYFILCIIHFI